MAAALRGFVIVAALVFACAANAAVTMQYPADSDEFTSIGCAGPTCLLTTGSEVTHGAAVLVMSGGQAGPVQPLGSDTGTLFAAGCASRDSCFAVGGNTENGQIVPVTAGTAQATQTLGDIDEFHAIACPAPGLCFAGGTAINPADDQETGAIVTISNGDPSGAQFVDGSNDILDLSCASASTCVGVASNANGKNGFFSIADGRAGDFRALSTPDPSVPGITGIDCPLVNQCVGVGLNYALPINNYTPGRWATIDNVASLDEFACWAPGRCTGTSTDQPDLVYIKDLRGGADLNLTQTMRKISALACPSTTLCFAGGRSNGGPAFGAIAAIPTADLTTGPPPTVVKCKVPKVIGLTLKKAKKKLVAAHCRLGHVTRKLVTSKRSKGRVLKQKPRKGTYAKNKRVAVTVGR